MKLITYLSLALFLTIAITSCKKDSPTGTTENKDKTDTTGTKGTKGTTGTTGNTGTTGTTDATVAAGVYVVGNLTDLANGSASQAVIWQNDVPTALSANPSGVKGIAITGKDIYAVGFDMPNLITQIPVYWKNGVVTHLSENQGTANAIAIQGGDVYIVGVDKGRAVYWKNGIKTELPSSNVYTEATGITIDGANIYISGDYGLAYATACYWKNDVLATLETTGATDSKAYDIALNGTDVYVVGYATGTFSSTKSATYWKNGHLTNLYYKSHTSQAYKVAVSNGSAYIGGTDGIAKYWKDGNIVEPAGSNPGGIGQTIAISGNSVYLGGSYAVSGNRYAPPICYWVDGNIKKLTIPQSGLVTSATVGIVTGIVVVK